MDDVLQLLQREAVVDSQYSDPAAQQTEPHVTWLIPHEHKPVLLSHPPPDGHWGLLLAQHSPVDISNPEGQTVYATAKQEAHVYASSTAAQDAGPNWQQVEPHREYWQDVIHIPPELSIELSIPAARYCPLESEVMLLHSYSNDATGADDWVQVDP